MINSKAILFLLIVSVSAYCCDMFAFANFKVDKSHLSDQGIVPKDSLLVKIYGNSPLEINRPEDLFAFLGQRSSGSSNSDGYGIAFYNNSKDSLGKFHQMGFDTYFKYPDSSKIIWQDALLNAYESYQKEKKGISIVLGHARNATGGTTIGNHPFSFDLDNNNDGIKDQTFTFEHNGDCTPLKPFLLNSLQMYDKKWFSRHPLNWAKNIPDLDTLNYNYMIDTELLFHFIMSRIEINGGRVIYGISVALKEIGALNNDFGHIINFIMSDGVSVYAFRNSEDGSGYNLEYKIINNSLCIKTKQDSLFVDIKSGTLFVADVNARCYSIELRTAIKVPPRSYYVNKNVNTDSNKRLYNLMGQEITATIAASKMQTINLPKSKSIMSSIMILSR